MTTATPQRDRLLRREEDLHSQMPRGVAFYDFLPRVSAPCIGRAWGAIEHEMRLFDCVPGELLCPGSACGLGHDGLIHHIRDYHELQGFVGFVEKTVSRGRVLVRTRGQVFLAVHDVRKEPGSAVFAVNPDQFSLDPTEAHQVGKILFVQPERPDLCCVAFRSFNDPKSPDLSLAGLQAAGGRTWNQR